MRIFSHQTTSDILQALLGPDGTILNSWWSSSNSLLQMKKKKKLVFQRFRAKLVEPKPREKHLYCHFYQENEGEEGRSLCCTIALSKEHLYLCLQEK